MKVEFERQNFGNYALREKNRMKTIHSCMQVNKKWTKDFSSSLCEDLNTKHQVLQWIRMRYHVENSFYPLFFQVYYSNITLVGVVGKGKVNYISLNQKINIVSVVSSDIYTTFSFHFE